MSKTDSDVEDLLLDTSKAPTTTTATTDGGGTTTRTENEDEGEEESDEEEEEVEEEEPEIYISEDFISGPSWPETSTIPEDILVFDYSFGYDCKRYDNLVVADENTLVFASGNFINFFDVKTRKLTFRKSAFGKGIGHIQTYPNTEHSHLVVAEQGINPPIIIYEWPSLEIFGLLKGGSTKRFTHMDYSPDGSLLVSQAGEPDYLITIWNWPVRKILLRTKSYVNDVYIVKFSPFCEGQLASCGVSHIKFWKMATTFTGLKLKGELGRFGKTEYSDIVGVLPLPDEKVLSGCQWGNVLVWDEGLIKYEICRRQRRKCHDGPIMYLAYNNGELWTAALDGRIRIWYFDSIDRADPPDDDRVVQAEPVYEFEFPGLSFMTLKKQMKNDPNNTIYFVQDGNGGIWRLDLTTEKDAEPPTQLYKCHAGAIADIAASPFGTHLATLGTDGYLFVYDYIRKTMLFQHQFPAKGVCMIWLPLTVEPSGDEIIMGFDDGNLRSVVLSIAEDGSGSHFNYYQLIKPHCKPITDMKLNPRGNILVTGSEDMTIFVFQTYQEKGRYTKLIPIGLVHVPDVVTCLYWQKKHAKRIMVGCLHGQYVMVHVPKMPQDYTTVTYELKVNVTTRCFKTYKAQIRRDIKIKEIEERRAKKTERKREEMERVKKENPGLEIDEDVFLADSESEEELEPLYIPQPPNKILWMQITPDDTIWLSMAGYDAGYIYEYQIDQTTDDVPYRFKMVDDADDIEISSYVYNYNNKYLIFAMQDGTIRVNRVNPDDHRDLSDYWKLPMHDNFKGYIPKMCFSFDEQYFFTCGEDGNVFSYTFHPDHNDYIKQRQLRVKTSSKSLPLIEDVGGYKTLSLEQMKVKAEEDRIEALANKHKQEVLVRLKQLKVRYDELLKRNSKLPPTQIIPKKELELDPRITKNLEDKLDANLQLVKRKLAFDVEKSALAMRKMIVHFVEDLDVFPITVYGIRTKTYVRVSRQRQLRPQFHEMQKLVENRIIEAELKGRAPERPPAEKPPRPVYRKREKKLEYFLLGLSPSTIDARLTAKLYTLLTKYRKRKQRVEKRQMEYELEGRLFGSISSKDTDNQDCWLLL